LQKVNVKKSSKWENELHKIKNFREQKVMLKYYDTA